MENFTGSGLSRFHVGEALKTGKWKGNKRGGKWERRNGNAVVKLIYAQDRTSIPIILVKHCYSYEQIDHQPALPLLLYRTIEPCQKYKEPDSQRASTRCKSPNFFLNFETPMQLFLHSCSQSGKSQHLLFSSASQSSQWNASFLRLYKTLLDSKWFMVGWSRV